MRITFSACARRRISEIEVTPSPRRRNTEEIVVFLLRGRQFPM